MAKVYFLLVMRIFLFVFQYIFFLLLFIFCFCFLFSFYYTLKHNYLLLDFCVKLVYICAFLETHLYTYTYFYTVHLIRIKTYERLILIVGDRCLEGLSFDFLKLHTHDLVTCGCVCVCVGGGGGGEPISIINVRHHIITDICHESINQTSCQYLRFFASVNIYVQFKLF